jgi:hypothetical protein
MSVSIRFGIVAVSVLLLGCTSQQSVQLEPQPAGALAGSYKLTGLIDGTRVSATLRVDDSSRVSTITTSPNGTHACEASEIRSDQLVARCGPVEVQLTVADNRIAPVGRLSFQAARRRKEGGDLFQCNYSPPDQLCQLPPQYPATPLPRAYGRVKVARASINQ